MKTHKQLAQLKGYSFLLLLIFSCGVLAQETSGNSITSDKNDSTLKWGPCPDFMPKGCNVTVLHGDPAERNADIFFKVPANSYIPKHTHTSPERMILVSGQMQITYEGEQPQNLTAGSYAYGPANKAHSAKCGDSPCVLFIAFEDPVDAVLVEED